MGLGHRRGEQAILWQAISKKDTDWRSPMSFLMWLSLVEKVNIL